MELLACTASGEVRYCTDCESYRILWMGIMVDFNRTEFLHFKHQLKHHHERNTCQLVTDVVVPTGLSKLWLCFQKEELLRFSALLDDALERYEALVQAPWLKLIELTDTPAISSGVHAIGSRQLIADFQAHPVAGHIRIRYGNWGIDLPHTNFWEVFEMLKSQVSEASEQVKDETAEHFLVLDTPLQNLKLLINTADAPEILNELERISWQVPEVQYGSGRLN